jgi:HAMP domain-containing protein
MGRLVGRTQAGAVVTMLPVEFAQYAFVAVAGISALSVVSAIARRISGPYSRRAHLLGAMDTGDSQRTIAALHDDVDALRGELESMRTRLAELDDVQNRLDFAERLLAQVKERAALPGGP